MNDTAKKFYARVHEQMTDAQYQEFDIERPLKHAFELLDITAHEIIAFCNGYLTFQQHGGKKPAAQILFNLNHQSPCEKISYWLNIGRDRFTECEHGSVVYLPIVAIAYMDLRFAFSKLRLLYNHPTWETLITHFEKFVNLTTYEGAPQMSHAAFSEALYNCHEDFSVALEDYFNALYHHLNARPPEDFTPRAMPPEKVMHVNVSTEKIEKSLDEVIRETRELRKKATHRPRKNASQPPAITPEMQNGAIYYWELGQVKDIPKAKGCRCQYENVFQYYQRELALLGITSPAMFKRAIRAHHNRVYNNNRKK